MLVAENSSARGGYMQFEAKTVEEATKNGLETLGITEEQAKITVIEQPVKGLFGRLKGKAVVEIEKIEENTKTEGKTKVADGAENENFVEECENSDEKTELREEAFLKQLLKLLDIKADVKVSKDGENETLSLVTDSSSSVIGYRGEVLDAMQTLTGAVANIGNKTYRKVVVDCENYRDRREETLIKLIDLIEPESECTCTIDDIYFPNSETDWGKCSNCNKVFPYQNDVVACPKCGAKVVDE